MGPAGNRQLSTGNDLNLSTLQHTSATALSSQHNQVMGLGLAFSGRCCQYQPKMLVSFPLNTSTQSTVIVLENYNNWGGATVEEHQVSPLPLS